MLFSVCCKSYICHQFISCLGNGEPCRIAHCVTDAPPSEKWPFSALFSQTAGASHHSNVSNSSCTCPIGIIHYRISRLYKKKRLFNELCLFFVRGDGSSNSVVRVPQIKEALRRRPVWIVGSTKCRNSDLISSPAESTVVCFNLDCFVCAFRRRRTGSANSIMDKLRSVSTAGTSGDNLWGCGP